MFKILFISFNFINASTGVNSSIFKDIISSFNSSNFGLSKLKKLSCKSESSFFLVDLLQLMRFF